MISFQPTYTIPSKVMHGVSFTIKRLSSIERAERELQHADAFDQLAQFQRDFAKLPEKAEDDTPQQTDRREVLTGRIMTILVAKIFPIVLRTSLVSVTGFDSVDDFLARGQDSALNEAYAFCDAASKLTPEQLKNLESPGTSNEAVAGQSETSSVATAAIAA